MANFSRPLVKKSDVVKQQMETFMNNNALADVIFVIGENHEKMFAHKPVLAASSKIFYELFSNKSQKDKIAEIWHMDCEPEAFRQVLKYIYFNRITITFDTALGIYHIVLKYQLKQLLVQSFQSLLKMIDQYPLDMVVKNLELNMKFVNMLCQYRVTLKLPYVIKPNYFMNLNTQLLMEIFPKEKWDIKQIYDILAGWYKQSMATSCGALQESSDPSARSNN